MLNIVKNNFQKSFISLIIILQSTMVFSFEMTDEGIKKAIQDYYLDYTQDNTYQVLARLDLGIDQDDFSNP